MLRPYPLSAVRIEAAALAEDKKRCRKIGPCGVGKQALYLNSYFLDRRYYIPFSAVDRVYKRIAMSKGGFSGKGIFATLAYLVVVFDGGREKAFQFKYEAQIDELLAVVRETYPDIPCVSAAAEKLSLIHIYLKLAFPWGKAARARPVPDEEDHGGAYAVGGRLIAAPTRSIGSPA